MQKKIIALAIAGLASTAVFAQSNVTIYGIADVGVSYYGDNVQNNVGSRTGVDSGQSAGSRLGFRGTEDLGNGLKAVFVLEQSVAIDTGTATGFTRQAYAGLAGGFGTVAFGRQYTPQFLFAAAVDPFARGSVGSAHSYMVDSRLDNLAAYISPKFGGFTVVVGATKSAGGDESADNKTITAFNAGVTTYTQVAADARVWAVAPSYSNGPLFVGLNVHRIQKNNQNYAVEAVQVYDLMASFDLGVVKLGAIYGVRNHDVRVANADIDMKQWMVGATVPVGAKAKVMASYNRRTTDFGAAWGLSDAKVGQWSVGAEYALSKRTSLYAGYAQQNQNTVQEAFNGPNGGAAANYLSVGMGDADTGSIANGGYQKAFISGIRHSF